MKFKLGFVFVAGFGLLLPFTSFAKTIRVKAAAGIMAEFDGSSGHYEIAARRPDRKFAGELGHDTSAAVNRGTDHIGVYRERSYIRGARRFNDNIDRFGVDVMPGTGVEKSGSDPTQTAIDPDTSLNRLLKNSFLTDKYANVPMNLRVNFQIHGIFIILLMVVQTLQARERKPYKHMVASKFSCGYG